MDDGNQSVDLKRRPGLFGYLANTVEINGDIVAPLDVVWEAEA